MNKHSPDRDSQSAVKESSDPVGLADMAYEKAPSASSILYLAPEAYTTQVSLGTSHLVDSFRRASIAKAHVLDLRECTRFGVWKPRTAACISSSKAEGRVGCV